MHSLRKVFACIRFLPIAGLSVFLAACMVGPDFHSPPPPSDTALPQPAKTVAAPGAGKAGKAQHLVLGRDIPAEWWRLFHSAALNELIDRGLENSPNLAAAEFSLTQAQENLRAQIGSLLVPNVNAQFVPQQMSFAPSTLGSQLPPQVFSLYNAQVNVSYVLDVWGGSRRSVEASAAQRDNAGYQLEAAYLVLTANIVTTAVNIASLQAQIQATNELIQIQQQQLSIVNRQFQLGGASGADVLMQKTQVAQTLALLPPLQKSLGQARDALSTLVGSFPGDNHLPSISLSELHLPTSLPVSLPSELVRQRPDILASEASLHAACAQIGVATANLLPQVTLSGYYGWTSNALDTLFSSMSNVWTYGANIVQPIINGGSLRAKRRGAIAGFQKAFEQYKQTVLTAFQNVADSLTAIQNDAKALRAQTQAEIAARATLAMTQKQFRLGGVSYLTLLNASRQYQQARINRIQAQAARYADTAALFQALGGGWWNRMPFPEAHV